MPDNADCHRQSKYLPSKLKALDSVEGFLEGRQFPAYPLEVFFEASNLCNLQCAMCGIFSGVNPARQERVRKVARGFIDFVQVCNSCSAVLEHALLVHCFGYGEPTLHPQFQEMLRFLAQYEVLIDFFTNAMRLSADMARFLVEQGVYRVTVSFSGASAKDYENMYLGGRFHTVLENIRRLAEFKKAAASRWPQIYINSIAFEHHIAGFDRFVELMADHGVNAISVKPLVVDQATLHLVHHAAVYQPKLHDGILERAQAIAAAREVDLDLTAWTADPADTPEEVTRIRTGRISAFRFDPSNLRQVESVPLESLPALAKSLRQQPARPVQKVPQPAIDVAHDPPHLVRDKLRMQPAPYSFYCMEPFSTLYIDAAGQARPCCFSAAPPGLGDILQVSAERLWQGIGFNTLRSGVISGSYPLMCMNCLANHNAPRQSFHAQNAELYAVWFESRFGQRIEHPLIQRQLTAASIDSAMVMQKLREQRPDLVSYSLQDARSDEEQAAAGSSAYAAAALRAVNRVLDGLQEVPDAYLWLCEGWLDGLVDRHLAGWLHARVFPQFRVPIRVLFDGEVVHETVANVPRDDLKIAGKGDGRHGFYIPLSTLPDLAEVREISVCVGSTTCNLRNGPLRRSAEIGGFVGAD